MITRLRWGGVVLGCMLTLGLAQEVLADTTLVQTGRRRAAARDAAATRETPPETPRPRSTTGTTAERPQPPTAPPSERELPSSSLRVPTEGRIDPLLQLAEKAIARTSQRYLDADQHTPWQIMHGVLALRRDFELTRGSSQVNCIEFISDAPTFRGEGWWQVTEHGGRAHPFSVPYAFEGHPNQFLALLSLSNLPLSHQFRVDDRTKVTMADMVEHAKMTVNAREEITWTLWFLTHYVDIDEEWINAAGQAWSMEELVRVQTASPVVGTACGGCHGLYAIAYARNAYLQKHGRLRGVYYQAEQKLNKHIELARTMQNYDGSFSTEFFKGTGLSRDFNERLKASGHMLEWLMMALPEDRLNEAWIRKAVASIATDLIHNASQPAECGPLYHALNSLIMYRDRARGPQTPIEELLELAETVTETKLPTGADVKTQNPTALPIVEPDAFIAPRSSTAARPDKPAETESPTAKPAEPSLPETKSKMTIATKPDAAEELARKAARRLVGTIRAEQPMAESERPADDGEPPGLLQAPDSGATQIASEPDDTAVR
jgi:hypothetical protein